MRLLVLLLLALSTVVTANPKKRDPNSKPESRERRIQICDNVIVQGREEPKILERTPPEFESLVTPPQSFRREPPEPLH